MDEQSADEDEPLTKKKAGQCLDYVLRYFESMGHSEGATMTLALGTILAMITRTVRQSNILNYFKQ